MPVLRRASAALGAIASLTAVAVIGVVTTGAPAAAVPPAAPAAVSAAVPTAVHAKVPVPNCCANPRLVPGQDLHLSPYLTDNTLNATTLPPSTTGTAYGQTYVGLDLTLQPDGNLVEYLSSPGSPTRAVWSTGTTTATRLVFQTDHNVVLYDGAGRALWSTGTAGSTAAFFSAYGNGQLVTQDAAGRVLSTTGPSLTALPGVVVQGAASVGRWFTVDVQSDGNLVEYDNHDRDHPRAVWSSHTAGVGPVRLIAQQDGNLVLRQVSTGRAVWASGTKGPTGYYQFDVQDDGNVVLYRTDGVHRVQAVWSTGVRR